MNYIGISDFFEIPEAFLHESKAISEDLRNTILKSHVLVMLPTVTEVIEIPLPSSIENQGEAKLPLPASKEEEEDTVAFDLQDISKKYMERVRFPPAVWSYH